MANKSVLEFRKNPVSSEWVLISSHNKKRPLFFTRPAYKPLPKSQCPFENLNTTKRKKDARLWLPKPGKNEFKDWWVQIIQNKYPVISPSHVCPVSKKVGQFERMFGVGFHEVVITRAHNKPIGKMSKEEISLLLEAYQSRYQALRSEPCVEHILIFHNSGLSAGASVPHPHSQILAAPIISPDVSRSLKGSYKYFKKNKRCVHCDIISWEQKEKIRVVYKNDSFVVFIPYASRVSFEIRIAPLKHEARFEVIDSKQREDLSDVLQTVFSKLYTKVNNPDYNFFVHTAPPKGNKSKHYHWHMEILPRLSVQGGIELGAGIDVVRVSPEESAKILRK